MGTLISKIFEDTHLHSPLREMLAIPYGIDLFMWKKSVMDTLLPIEVRTTTCILPEGIVALLHGSDLITFDNPMEVYYVKW